MDTENSDRKTREADNKLSEFTASNERQEDASKPEGTHPGPRNTEDDPEAYLEYIGQRISVWCGGVKARLAMLTANQIIAIFTVVIALTGISYSFFAWRQWCVMSGQLNDFESSERAILTVSPAVDASENTFTFTIENIGHTAALEIMDPIGGPTDEIPFVGAGWPGDRVLKSVLIDPPPSPQGFSLPAGCKRNVTFPIDNTSDIQRLFFDKGNAFFIYMNVGYKDIFGHAGIPAHGCFYWHGSVRVLQNCLGSKEWLANQPAPKKKQECNPN